MSQYEHLRPNVPARSVFDLSYDKKLTCDMGQLIPIMCEEVVPGDKFTIGHEIVIRFMPLVAPILHEINLFVHEFFVPYRILWELWEQFITGGEDGQDETVPPTWEPDANTNVIGKLWDYFGFPTGIIPTGAFPLDFPRRAYNKIYNLFYRDQNNVDEVDEDNEEVLIRSWEKDYFTSAMPNQQRGIAPSLPISGSSSAIFNSADFPYVGIEVFAGVSGGLPYVQQGLSSIVSNQLGGAGDFLKGRLPDTFRTNVLNDNTVSFENATTFDVADLRLAFQIQRWMERNQRAGVRYPEFLQAHFGYAPKDERLQRPEYIGGMKVGVVVSEVVQTSSTDVTSPQGNMAGHGMGIGRGLAASYRVPEYGLIIGIMSVMPRAAYQQGIDRQWLRRTRYDYYFPEFANLSEQAIERAEIYASAVQNENLTIFGYQAKYDEMRVKRNMVCGLMRTTFDHWHLGRQFSAAPELNQTFIECVPRKDIFAAPSQPGLLVNCRNIIKAVRPLPVNPEPGLVDHG